MRKGHKQSAEARRKIGLAHLGKTVSKETRARLSAAKKGRKLPPRSVEHRAKLSAAHKGKKVSPETRLKLRIAHLGKRMSAESRAKMGAAHRGKKLSPEARAKLSAALMGNTINKGRILSPEIRAKISAALTGERNHNFGKPLSAEARARLRVYQSGPRHPFFGKPVPAERRAKIRASLLGKKHPPERRAKYSGPNAPGWRGGIAGEQYPYAFRKAQARIRDRDEHKCILCGISVAAGESAHDVHHIDYVKVNNDPVNLVTLCHSCHSRTNHNRDHWTRLFQAVMLRRPIVELCRALHLGA